MFIVVRIEKIRFLPFGQLKMAPNLMHKMQSQLQLGLKSGSQTANLPMENLRNLQLDWRLLQESTDELDLSQRPETGAFDLYLVWLLCDSEDPGAGRAGHIQWPIRTASLHYCIAMRTGEGL